MNTARRPTTHVSDRLVHLSWVIPLTLSVLGIGYTVLMSVQREGNLWPTTATSAGLVLLGVVGPLLTYLALRWAARRAARHEEVRDACQREHALLLALHTVGEAVNRSLDVDTVLDETLDKVLEVMGVDSGEVRLMEGDSLVVRAARQASPAVLSGEVTIPLGYCLCGTAAQRGELIAVEDLGELPGYAGSVCVRDRYRAVLCVPMRTAERVLGLIHLASHLPRSFDPSERRLLADIGLQVGAAIERAQLHHQVVTLNQQLEARVAERTSELSAAKVELTQKAETLHAVLTEERRVEERTRAAIANDLHDGVQQLIVGALLELQAARDTTESDPLMAAAHITTVQDLLRRIEGEMRHAIYSLRPVALDTHGLVAALRECTAGFERVSGVRCHLRVDGTPMRFKPEAELGAFRIVQEALNNAETHARAGQVTVWVQFGQSELCVQVTDDGTGFDVASVTAETRNHIGLIGMRERAESAGGTLELWSRPGEGTGVCLYLPLSREPTLQ